MTSSDAIMLAQLCAALLVATAVAYISTIRSSASVHGLLRFNAYMSIGTLTLSVILCLLVAAFPGSSAVFLYLIIGFGALTTGAALWGQLQATLDAPRTAKE